jgi:Divergent InlB B-repeat domain
LHIGHQGRGGGTVSVLGGPRCGGDCTFDVLQGRVLTLTADAPAGTRFDGWTAPDSCRATATCDVQVRGETTVIARFSRVSPPPRRFTLTVRAVGTGTVDACDGARSCAHTYDAGTNVALTARAHEARATVRWTGARCRGDVCTVRMTRDRTVRMAVIRPPRVTLRWTGTPCTKDACALDPRKDTAAKGAFGPRRYTLDIRTYPGGSVQAGDVRCQGLAPCRHAYGYGTPLALVAVPDPGFAFAGWAGCPSPTGETCQLPVTSDRMVVANFVGPS